MPISFSTGRSMLVFAAGLLLLAFTCSSCGDTRQITYMQGKFDTAKLSEIKIPEPTIQKGDLVEIIVYSDNPTATALYNQSLITVGSNAGGGAASGAGGNGA